MPGSHQRQRAQQVTRPTRSPSPHPDQAERWVRCIAQRLPEGQPWLSHGTNHRAGDRLQGAGPTTWTATGCCGCFDETRRPASPAAGSVSKKTALTPYKPDTPTGPAAWFSVIRDLPGVLRVVVPQPINHFFACPVLVVVQHPPYWCDVLTKWQWCMILARVDMFFLTNAAQHGLVALFSIYFNFSFIKIVFYDQKSATSGPRHGPDHGLPPLSCTQRLRAVLMPQNSPAANRASTTPS